MVQLSLDGMQDAVDKGLDLAQPLLFGVGFIWGSTAKQAAAHQGQIGPSGQPYSTDIAWRIKDTLSNLGLGGITVAPGYVSTSNFAFRPLGFVNKGLAAALGAWIYQEAKLPYHKQIYKAVFPFGVGYAIGGFFDPPPGYTSPGIGGASGVVAGSVATAGLSAGYSMSGSGGVATGNVPFLRAESGGGIGIVA